TVSFDIAGMWRPKEFLNNKFSVGMNLSNLGPKISYIDQAQADPIPTNLRLGFAYNVFQDEYNSLTFTLDFSKLLVTRSDDTTSAAVQRDEFYEAIISSWGDQSMNEEIASIETGIGLEYWYGKPEDFRFAARAGFFYEDPNYGNRKFLTLGAGIRYDMFGFDFSYLTTSVFEDGENHPLSDTLRFTLLIGWGSVPQQIAGLPRGI
ncbi:MAG: PorV/PorQ family protein, partial [Melioribacteraceae bacterium]|nr:PorV/PorQ family protein [Melioribacteraceae bacterium]